MKKIFSFCILFNTIILLSQQSKCVAIYYDMSLNFNNYKNYNAFLNISDDASTFVYQEKVETDDNEENEFGDINISIINKNQNYIFTNNKTGEITEVTVKTNQTEFLKIIDQPQKINWTILPDYKLINEFKSQKAEGVFRGRKYIVWFTSEIPVSNGPLKLHGLPGAVLEISDSKSEVLLTAKKVSGNCIPDLMKLEKMQGKLISRKEYLEDTTKKIKDITNNISSKTPRGYKVSVKNMNIKSIEIDE